MDLAITGGALAIVLCAGIITLMAVQLIRYPDGLLPVFTRIISERSEVKIITPEAGIIPDDIWQLVQALEKGYQTKNLRDINGLLSSAFNYNGMDAGQFLSAIEKSFLFAEYSTVSVEVIDYTGTADEARLTWLLKTDFGYISQFGYLSKPGGVIPIGGAFDLIRENGVWKVFGNRQKRKTGLYRRTITLEAAIETVNSDAYREWLPTKFSLPKKPCVFVSFISNEDVNLPFQPYRLASVQLACEYQGKAGKTFLTIPETDWVPVEFGKSFGYPKYLADDLRFEAIENRIVGSVKHEDKPLFDITFIPDKTNANPLEQMSWKMPFLLVRKMLPAYAEQPIFLIKTLRDKKWLIKCQPELYRFGQMFEQFGTARVKTEQSDCLKALIPGDITVPARMFLFSGDYNLRHTLLEEFDVGKKNLGSSPDGR